MVFKFSFLKRKGDLRYLLPERKVLIRIFGCLYFVIALAFASYHIYFAGKIIKGVWVDDINLSGLAPKESVNRLNSHLVPAETVTLRVGNNYSTKITSEEINFRYLPIDTTKKAFAVGRSGDFFLDTRTKLEGFLGQKYSITPGFKYNESDLSNILENVKTSSLREVQEPKYILKDNGLGIEAGVSGLTFDEKLAKKEIINGLKKDGSTDVNISVSTVKPILSVSELDSVKSKADKLILRDFIIKAGDFERRLSPKDLVELIIPQKRANNIVFDVKETELISLLQDISSQIDRNPRGQILEVKNGKAVKFFASETGRKVRIKESAEKIKEALLSGRSTSELVIDIAEPPKDENEFGIHDLLGRGVSKFKGSSRGRVHNIGLAASRINGSLVPPGSVFSFNESVGKINRKTGYTSAWVISKGRTVLGDGGGVCQVSTTLFRAALNAGLPIVERNAHSYRVSYYEQDSPVGIDATVYQPSVDLKFRNDTDGYLLITSEFDPDNYSLIFNIYGKDDGRDVEISKPKVLSRSAPPPPVYEEDASLPKGVTKQVEHSVWGAKVTFTRKVLKDGTLLYNDVFNSTYRPWAAVFKVGTKE